METNRGFDVHLLKTKFCCYQIVGLLAAHILLLTQVITRREAQTPSVVYKSSRQWNVLVAVHKARAI